MNPNRRKALQTAGLLSSTAWMAPVVKLVILPSHAMMSACSGGLWHFQIEYTESNCPNASCDSIPVPPSSDADYLPLEPPRNEAEEFCLDAEEINEAQFNRDIDLDGMGPPADYISVSYIIKQITETRLSGTVVTLNVDSFNSERGHWQARRIG